MSTAAVRWVGFDVDGVLTDAGVYVGGGGVELKRFDIQDGLGIKLLQRAGLEVAFVSARTSAASAARAEELGVALHHVKGRAKHLVIDALLAERGWSWAEAAFVGDDLVDIPVLRRCAVSAAPANAVAEVAAVSRQRLRSRGGHGAVREFVEWFLRDRGEWDDVVTEFVGSLEGQA